MKRNPKVTVLMSVYNGQKYLRESIDSILNQTFKDFEFLIIDDGSTDSSADIIRSYSDSRIRLIQNEKNIGLPQSLNTGLAHAHGEFVARHDADDISLPQRFARQLEHLEKHEEIDVLGTQMDMIDESGSVFDVYKIPLCHSLITWSLLFDRSFAHATTFIRINELRNIDGYDPNCLYAEDIDLWVRLAGRARFANLPDSLYYYRINRTSVCQSYRIKQVDRVIQIRRRFASRILKKDVPADVLRWLNDSIKGSHSLSSGQLRQVMELTLDLFDNMQKQSYFLDAEIPMVRSDLIRRLTASAAGLMVVDKDVVRNYFRSILPKPIYLGAMAIVHPKLALCKAMRYVYNLLKIERV